jgi:hypothetical protein
MIPSRDDLGYGREQSTRSMNTSGPRMPRRENSRSEVLDKEARASNRARRLRAMGEGSSDTKNVRLLRRSQSFASRSPNSSSHSLSDTASEHHPKDPTKEGGEENSGEEKKGDESPVRKTPSRSNSGLQISPEEQQYARTAARGITRTKSLRAERINIDATTKSVANKLQSMRSAASSGGPRRPTRRLSDGKGNDGEDGKKDTAAASKKEKYATRNSRGEDTQSHSATPSSSPKAVALQW